jgi:hypothetical protein
MRPVQLVEVDGVLVAAADVELPTLTAEQVRDGVEDTRL